MLQCVRQRRCCSKPLFGHVLSLLTSSVSGIVFHLYGIISYIFIPRILINYISLYGFASLSGCFVAFCHRLCTSVVVVCLTVIFRLCFFVFLCSHFARLCGCFQSICVHSISLLLSEFFRSFCISLRLFFLSLLTFPFLLCFCGCFAFFCSCFYHC